MIFCFHSKGKLGGAAAITKASFFLDRLSYTHAILGETVTLISKYCVENCTTVEILTSVDISILNHLIEGHSESLY